MSSDEAVEETNGDSFGKVKQRFKDPSQVGNLIKFEILLCFFFINFFFNFKLLLYLGILLVCVESSSNEGDYVQKGCSDKRDAVQTSH